MVGLIFADSNILIFSVIQEYPEFKIANKKLAEFAKKTRIAVNDIILSEVFHKISVLKTPEAARLKLKDILENDFVVYIPIEKATIMKALDLAVKHKVRINDSIIAQHALDTKSDGIFTDNVKDFKKIKKLKIVALR